MEAKPVTKPCEHTMRIEDGKAVLCGRAATGAVILKMGRAGFVQVIDPSLPENANLGRGTAMLVKPICDFHRTHWPDYDGLEFQPYQ